MTRGTALFAYRGMVHPLTLLALHLLPGHPLVLAADLVAAAMSRLAEGHRVRRAAAWTSRA
ncbi:MAG TPA: hypothetical protein VE673_08775 [Pseudonocardiaceae bacterium]|nr:hypothetical protein [Pseudonocardiaceae bacterium]